MGLHIVSGAVGGMAVNLQTSKFYSPIQVPRWVGSREGSYTLVAYSDASAAIYGVVVYIIENESGKTNFLMAKNKVVSSNLTNKSIPSLECQGVHLAVETLCEICTELGAGKNDLPINFTQLFVYTDSMVTLAWIKSYFENYDKMQKRTTYVLNRLKQIGEMCEMRPIKFRYIAGHKNFADYISRAVSYNKLKATNYFSGPELSFISEEQPDIQVTVPAPFAGLSDSGEVTLQTTSVAAALVRGARDCCLERLEPLVVYDEYSSFDRLIKVHANVLKFIHRLKVNVGRVGPSAMHVLIDINVLPF